MVLAPWSMRWQLAAAATQPRWTVGERCPQRVYAIASWALANASAQVQTPKSCMEVAASSSGWGARARAQNPRRRSRETNRHGRRTPRQQRAADLPLKAAAAAAQRKGTLVATAAVWRMLGVSPEEWRKEQEPATVTKAFSDAADRETDVEQCTRPSVVQGSAAEAAPTQEATEAGQEKGLRTEASRACGRGGQKASSPPSVIHTVGARGEPWRATGPAVETSFISALAFGVVLIVLIMIFVGLVILVVRLNPSRSRTPPLLSHRAEIVAVGLAVSLLAQAAAAASEGGPKAVAMTWMKMNVTGITSTEWPPPPPLERDLGGLPARTPRGRPWATTMAKESLREYESISTPVRRRVRLNLMRMPSDSIGRGGGSGASNPSLAARRDAVRRSS